MVPIELSVQFVVIVDIARLLSKWPWLMFRWSIIVSLFIGCSSPGWPRVHRQEIDGLSSPYYFLKNDMCTRTTMSCKSNRDNLNFCHLLETQRNYLSHFSDVRISRFGMLIVFIATRKELLSSTNRLFFYLVFTMIIFIISF